MPTTISDLNAFEILDSRGRPTLSVGVELSNGIHARADVPSGASTGANEVVELRDDDPDRYSGQGVLAAVGSVNRQMRDSLAGRKLETLDDLIGADELLLTLDGTGNLSRLGANSTIGVSIALTRALARSTRAPLWLLISTHLKAEARLPVPHFNVVNGGAHAATELDFQEFMIAPRGAPSFGEAVRAGAEIYAALRKRLIAESMPVGLGDEGGFALPVRTPEEVLTILTSAIEDAGYRAARDSVAFALDPAANGFYENGRYRVAGQDLSSNDMINWYGELATTFPIWSIEDGLAEDDHDGWQAMTESLGEKVQIVGDDIFVTDPERIQAAAADKIANAALIKPNQIGTVSQTLRALEVCKSVGYAQMVSHRSGETSDDFIADLAIGAGCGQLKSGAPARGERVAKYNRILHVEHQEGLRYGGSGSGRA